VTDDAEPSSAAQSGIAGSACVTLRIIWPNFLPAFWHNRPKLAERIATDPSAEVMILIAGATGTNGMELIQLLARQGIGIRALVRSPDRPWQLRICPELS
jgi:hypothetical protein